MRIRMTRPWRIEDVPFATLDVGDIFDVPSQVAMYLRAMGCAESVNVGLPPGPTVASAGRLSRLRWRLGIDNSAAEARLKIAGQWHRLRVELDDAIMRTCSFYLRDDDLGRAFSG